MKRIMLALCAAGALGVAMGPSSAHHSISMFDNDKEFTVEGVVKEFQYTNPHSWLIVDVANEDGTTTTWGFEGGARTTMTLLGIRWNTLQPGTKVTVVGNPMRDGSPAGRWIRTIMEDGTVHEIAAEGVE